MFDLTRETVSYDFLMPGGQRLIATIRWPEPAAVRKLYQETRLRMKQLSRDEVEWTGSDNTRFDPFLIDHLTELNFSNGRVLQGDIEEHKRFLERRQTNVGFAVIAGGLLWCRAERPDDESETLDQLLSSEIVTTVREWDASEGQVTRHELVHSLTEPTAQQQQQYRAANRWVEKPQKNQRYLSEDPLAITNLYRARISRIGGASVGSAPCESENKDDWVDRVPYSWIQAVMIEDNRGADAENFS